MWATIYHVQSGSSVGSFVPLLRDLGSGEGISADYCHQKTSLLGRVASHQSTGMVTDWIVGKVIPSDLEAVEPGFCSEDKNAQNMNSCTNLEVFLSHRQEQSFQAILETERLPHPPHSTASIQHSFFSPDYGSNFPSSLSIFTLKPSSTSHRGGASTS